MLGGLRACRWGRTPARRARALFLFGTFLKNVLSPGYQSFGDGDDDDVVLCVVFVGMTPAQGRRALRGSGARSATSPWAGDGRATLNFSSRRFGFGDGGLCKKPARTVPLLASARERRQENPKGKPGRP